MAPGAEGGDAGDQTLIAAFPIRRHFDIRRQYNPINGQENNVIQENDFDRPWWERDYMRVDWSQNVVQDYDINGWVRFRMGQDGVTARAADSDPDEPLARSYLRRLYRNNNLANLALTPSVCNATGDWFVTCERSSALTRYKMSFMKVDQAISTSRSLSRLRTHSLRYFRKYQRRD